MSDTLQLVCAHCLTPNRVPRQRLDDHPKCGKCKQTLMTGKPVELSESNFHRFVNSSDLPVVVDFWASWCGPCQMMAPHFSAAATQLEPRIRLAKINTESAPGLSTQLGIRSIPTLIAFRQGWEIGRISGALGQQQIVEWAQGLSKA